MHRHPWRRLLAWLIDWMCVLAWAAIVAAVAIPLYLAGVTGRMDPLTLNIVASATLVVPVTLAFAWLESSGWHATLGKRALGIRVVAARTGAAPAADDPHDTDDSARTGAGPVTARVSFGRALARNALKITVPWVLGHAAAYGLNATSPDASPSPWLWVVTIVAYALPISYVVSLFVRRGATPYDLVAGTSVVRSI